MYKKLLAILGLTLFSSAVLAQEENPFLGTWDIDMERSNFGSASVPGNISRSYADLGDGHYMFLVVTTNEDGTVGATSASYDYSGEHFPMASLDALPTPQISYRRINETTVEYTVYLDGEVQQIGARFISPNYQQLSIAIQFPNSTQEDQILIFNKRS
ncbi:MAG: hypothetical protein GKR91_06420 [Pseudomonadales bacterium]|nr:hypothetical protein [Pseudomonadales bacterium]